MPRALPCGIRRLPFPSSLTSTGMEGVRERNLPQARFSPEPGINFALARYGLDYPLFGLSPRVGASRAEHPRASSNRLCGSGRFGPGTRPGCQPVVNFLAYPSNCVRPQLDRRGKISGLSPSPQCWLGNAQQGSNVFFSVDCGLHVGSPNLRWTTTIAGENACRHWTAND